MINPLQLQLMMRRIYSFLFFHQKGMRDKQNISAHLFGQYIFKNTMLKYATVTRQQLFLSFWLEKVDRRSASFIWNFFNYAGY